MKILIISNMYPSRQKPYSGIFVKNQYEYLKNVLKQDIDIFAMRRQVTGTVGNILKYAKAFSSFSMHYLLNKYDIVHVHFFYPTIFFALVYRLFHPNTKIIVTFHGSDINNHFTNKFSQYIFSRILQQCDFVISVGNNLSLAIQDKLKRHPDIVLSAGIDKNVFFPDPHPEKSIDFLFVGSLIERKGVDILLQAIALLDSPESVFCFVGTGKLENDVISLQTKYPNIRFLKSQSQEQLQKLYTVSKFLVLPSRCEPFGLVVSEAMFCGTPAIVSNVGGLKEQVVDGVNGFVLDENTPEALAQTMKKALALDANAYMSLAQNSLQSNQKHALDQVCEALVHIYQSVYEA